MRINRIIAAPLAAAVLLTACGEQKPDEAVATDARGAEREILGGSISDAMIPLDTVQSQSPPARGEPSDNDTARETGDED